MNWEALGAIGELLGALFVVSTLVYLSRQVRESNSHASAEVERHIQDRWNNLMMYWTRDETMRDIIRRGHRSFAQLTDSEKIVFHTSLSLGVNHLEMILRMNVKKLVPKDILDTYGTLALSMLRTNGGREFWELAGSTFPRLSKRYIDERLNDRNSLNSLDINLPWWVADD